ncbi:MAG: hypothetical protein NZ703_11790 [Gemmataceae bacterium]|nr:hypothetical protein [Gemmataceae bacterium]MCS7271751.1 hypothetical protein [Gemmataceae bacterium]MDW8242042.1 hypothetical protein [Thermogemmata sp.]
MQQWPLAFNPHHYGSEVAALLAEPRLAELGPGQPVLSVEPQLRRLKLSPACRAGLWLYFDFLDESHRISQDLATAEGSFWHAIMHRREPDAWNSKYWWRRVGHHRVIDQLRQLAPVLGYHYTTPEDFVDYCEKVRGTASTQEEVARQVQLLEWQLLFDHCYRQTTG